MKPVVSISMLCLNRREYTERCLKSIFENTTVPFDLWITDNGSTDGTVEMLRKIEEERAGVRVWYNPENEGFIVPHNLQAFQSSGQYVCVLNNDVEVGPGWMENLLGGFRGDPTVAQVGPKQDYGFLTPEFLGTGGADPFHPEYIGGWCFVVPRTIVERYGLFDADELAWATAEDSDFSLRLRKYGWSIRCVEANIVHHQYKTMDQGKEVLGYDPMENEKANRLRMKQRWAQYLETRTFNQYRVLIIRQDALGDVLCTEPVAAGLRWKYPKAHIELLTRCPEVMATCPHLDDVSANPNIRNEWWDEVHDLTLCYERNPGMHLVEAYCRQVRVPWVKPAYRIRDDANRYRVRIHASRPMIALCADGSWPNRTWSLDRFRELASWLSMSAHIVELGTKRWLHTGVGESLIGLTKVHDAAAILSQAALFVGCDGFLYHLASAVGTPSVILWGATHPYKRVHDPRSIPVLRKDLPCQGCHHRLPAPRCHTTCDRGQHMNLSVADNACMDISVEAVKQAIVDACERWDLGLSLDDRVAYAVTV